MSQAYYEGQSGNSAGNILKVPTEAEKKLIRSYIGPYNAANPQGAAGNQTRKDSGATGTAWRNLTSPTVSAGEEVQAWSAIFPTPSGYGLQHYDKFFSDYSGKLTSNYSQTGAAGATIRAPKLPPKNVVENWVKNADWRKVQIDPDARAKEILDLYDEVKKADLSETTTESNNLYAWNDKVFTMFEKMLGIPKKIIPSIYSYPYDAGIDLGVQGRLKFVDIKDVLMYLYLEAENARRDDKQRLQELLDYANLDDFEGFKPEETKTAGGALEVRAAQKLNKKIKAGTKLTEADKELLRALASNNMDFFHAKVRDTDQCLLRLNLEAFSTAYYTTNGSLHRATSHQRRTRPHESIYQDSMSPATIINKLAFSPRSGPFIDARTHEISQLTPMIRLFKTYYNEETNRIDEEIEFQFDGGSQPEKSLSSRTGVGIKSFEWNLNATNPSTVKNDITATLTLYFQGFNELTREHTYTETKTGKIKRWQYQDLLIRPQRRDKETTNTQPIPAGSTACSDRSRGIYDSRFYEVKALVGWSPPNTLESSSKVLVESIKNQQMPLFLTLIDHEFSFTQEGTYELKITYRARMEALNSDPRLDVLTTPARKEAVHALLVKMKEARKNCDSKEAIQDIQDEIALEREVDRDRLASSIIEGLEPYIYISSVKTEDIHKALLDSTSGADIMTVKNLVINRWQVQNAIKNNDEKLKEKLIKQLKAKQVESSGKGTPKQKEEAEKAATGDPATAPDNPNMIDISDPSTTRIPWFYFGDLVDVVVRHAIENNSVGSDQNDGIVPGVDLKNLTYLMGTYDYTKIGRWDFASVGGGVKVLTPFEIERKVGHLSAVPITVASYNSWFIRNVVDAERATFPISEFLRSFIQQVVVPVLNRKCFDTDNFKVSFTSGQLEYRDTPKKGDWIEISPLIPKTAAISLPPVKDASKEMNPLEQFRVNPKEVDEFISAKEINLASFVPPEKDLDFKIPTRRDNSISQTVQDSYHVSVFYLLSQDSFRDFGPPLDPKVDRQSRDEKRGVYHLYLGADVGLVKEVSFSKVDAPYLREARIQQDSLNPLAQLAATYNVNLKMVGNTIFWPGQYIFVNPVGFGTGQPWDIDSISNQLGLGGYHLITEVKSFVEDGQYETTIKGLFEFSGDGCPSLPQATPTDPCEPDFGISNGLQENDGPEGKSGGWL